MRRGFATALTALGLGTAFVTLVLPVWGLRCLTREREALRAVVSDGDQLKATSESLRRETKLRRDLTARLAAGELSLAAATAELEPLMKTLPGFEGSWQFHYRTPTFRLAVARYAISKAVNWFGDGPFRAAKLVGRLEEEFRAMACEEDSRGVVAVASGGSR